MAKHKKTLKKSAPARKDWRNFLWYVLITFVVISVVTASLGGGGGPAPIDFSEFITKLNQGRISEVTIRTSDRLIIGKTKDGQEFKSYFIEYPTLMENLQAQKVRIKVNPRDSGRAWNIFSPGLSAVYFNCPVMVFFIFRQAQGANSQAMSFGKTRAKPWEKKDQKERVTFKDIAGVDEAVEELKEIVEYLKKPEKFKKLGARLPKGALLMGPPGTGKTLLAKAIAGEADVPFFNLSGSDFVEMFVGVGASRVRDLFAQAKKNSPAIIFVDEIDAVGRHRGAGLGGGHDEREQTLNALLVEMDGFTSETTVIVIAATNRPDILDPALLRPGRFDRQITVDKPDIKGREQILRIHAKSKKLARKLDLRILARRTPGFTGADLANVVNEAALLAARRGKAAVGLEEMEEAVERVMAGPERKSRVMSEREKEIIAYHEVGHALVAVNVDEKDPVHKISILPRGAALGYTLQLPLEDRYLVTRQEIINKIEVLMGGRVAEEIQFGEITTGASNDIERATELARNFVCRYGMSEVLGPRKYGSTDGQVFLGRQFSDHTKDYSESTAKEIDAEIRKLIREACDKAKRVLEANKDILVKIAKVLLDREVIEGEEFLKLAGKPPRTDGIFPKVFKGQLGAATT